MRPYSPGGVLNALAPALKGSLPQAPSTHRLRRGLPGYLILFAPHAVAHQRQLDPSRPPSPPVFFRISTHSTATPGIPSASSRLELRSILGRLVVEHELSPRTSQAAYAPFTPSDSGQRSHPPYYRGCWHGVSRCFLTRYRHTSRKRSFVPGNRGLRSENLHPPRGVAASAFRPLRKIPHCCLP